MDKRMWDIIGAVISIIIGAGLLIFRNFLTQFAVQAWLKSFKVRISEIPYKFFILLIGVLFIVSGVITVKGIFFK